MLSLSHRSLRQLPVLLLLLLSLGGPPPRFFQSSFSSSTVSFTNVAAEEQVKWTGNEERKSLPLSMKQRQQLLKLQQTIQNSPDPQATLAQVAQANQMTPQELGDMLVQNHNDLQQNPNLLSSSSNVVTKVIWNAMASLTVLILTWAKQHPSLATLSSISILLVLYLALTIPRTGGVLSNSRGGIWFSRGPTTWLTPPTPYLSKRLNRMEQVLEQRSVSVATKKTTWDDLVIVPDDDKNSNSNKKKNAASSSSKDDNGVSIVVHKLRRGDELVQAITAQVSIRPTEFLKYISKNNKEESNSNSNSKDDNKNEEKETELPEDGEEEEWNGLMDLLLEQAATVLSSRQLTEFVTDTPLPTMKYVGGGVGRSKFGILVVPGIGDFRRRGLVHWQVTQQGESDEQASLTLTTLKGLSHWDGQLHFSVERTTQNQPPRILLQVHFVVPRQGKKLSVRQAQRIAAALVHSWSTSTRRRTQLSLARQSQSSRFQGKAARRASERRHQRHQKEMDIEEMSEDRRRRWQRNNPDAGRYRPSGARQQSPNNC
jgi:hypothetical protein